MTVEGKNLRGDFREVDDDSVEVFEQYPVASWSVPGADTLYFPVESIKEDGGNRIVLRERPYRDGAKLDDTGSKAKRWVLSIRFDNSIQEPGLNNGGKSLYPEVVNALIASADKHETGDLVVPTRGSIRARLETYGRTEVYAERDCATCSFTFVQDNEDNVDAASFTAPTASANARQKADEAVFSAQSEGAWDGSLQDLNEAAGTLEGIANAPGDAIHQVEETANIVLGAADRVVKAFSNTSKEGRTQFLQPRGNSTERKVLQLQDMAGREKVSQKRGRRRLVSRVFKQDYSLAAIATIVQQDYVDLVEINPQLENPLLVPAGDIVRVFDNA